MAIISTTSSTTISTTTSTTTMTFSVYNQITHPKDCTYKLIQLPKQLAEYIKSEPNKPLSFKAPTNVKNQLAICTDTSTYTVRQMNHSNTQLLMNDMAINTLGKSLAHADSDAPPQSLLSIGSMSYLYEVTETDGHIDTMGVPTYTGSGCDISEATKTIDDVCDDSPIAPQRFLACWYAIGGSVVDGKAVLLAPQLITDVLYTMISLMIAKSLESFDIDAMAADVAEHNAHFSREMVITVASKFRNADADTSSLDPEHVARWFGIETLRNHPKTFSEKELLLEWKSSLPAFYNASLDLKLLLGHYCRPMTGQIWYLRPDSLNTDLHSRIKEMFQIVKEWDFDEFLPFVSAFVPASKKPDSVILKYARKKRVGKKFVVCPR
ncbi:hypothetical protein JCM33374_g4030 [Metschnikowia sp. JCM 33374]|nr:hypothetical protein JCM33374_g4030 [Metschnikowia sp. JCM 33374]